MFIWSEKRPVPAPLLAGIIHEQCKRGLRNGTGFKTVHRDDKSVHVVRHVSNISGGRQIRRGTIPDVRILKNWHQQIVVILPVTAHGENRPTVSRLKRKGVLIFVGVEETPKTICRRFAAQFVWRAFSFARDRVGSSRAARTAMIAITTRSSTRVNPASRDA